MANSNEDRRELPDAAPAETVLVGADFSLARHMAARRDFSRHLVDTAVEMLLASRRIAGRAPMADLDAEMRVLTGRLAELEHARVHYAGVMGVE